MEISKTIKQRQAPIRQIPQRQVYQPPQRQGYQEYQNRGYRGGEVTCYSCGESGHRSFECRQQNQGNAQNQQNQGNVQNRGFRNQGDVQDRQQYQGNAQGVDQNLNRPQPTMPQPATCVGIHEDNLGLLAVETDPVESVKLPANTIEIVSQERGRVISEKVKNGIYTAKDAAYLAAMAEKRKRTENEDVGAQLRRGARAGGLQTEGNANPIVPSSAIASQGVPFVPDPYFEDPAVQSQFISAASVPKARKVRTKEVKPKKHIKMMQDVEKWNPVESLRESASNRIRLWQPV